MACIAALSTLAKENTCISSYYPHESRDSLLVKFTNDQESRSR